MPKQIQSDNMDLTPSMKVLAEQKLIPLEAHLGDRESAEAEIRVVMNKAHEQDRFQSKVELLVGGKAFFGDSVDFSLETALIKAVDEVDKQYIKEKEKSKDRNWEESRQAKRLSEDELKNNQPDSDITGA